jgi:hypothetical protein
VYLGSLGYVPAAAAATARATTTRNACISAGIACIQGYGNLDNVFCAGVRFATRLQQWVPEEFGVAQFGKVARMTGLNVQCARSAE